MSEEVKKAYDLIKKELDSQTTEIQLNFTFERSGNSQDGYITAFSVETLPEYTDWDGNNWRVYNTTPYDGNTLLLNYKWTKHEGNWHNESFPMNIITDGKKECRVTLDMELDSEAVQMMREYDCSGMVIKVSTKKISDARSVLPPDNYDTIEFFNIALQKVG